MMKKIIGFLILGLAAVVLVGCNQNSLDGEYYFYVPEWSTDKVSDSPWIVIKGKTLTYYSGGKDDPSGTRIYSIDTDKKTLTGNNEVIAYNYEEDIFHAGIESSDAQFVKKDSEKYKELKEKED